MFMLKTNCFQLIEFTIELKELGQKLVHKFWASIVFLHPKSSIEIFQQEPLYNTIRIFSQILVEIFI